MVVVLTVVVALVRLKVALCNSTDTLLTLVVAAVGLPS
tara:strand:+ start:257 stop:370 length:114 start_codon:yes stop_codon:yes gene_type:complete